MKFITYILFKVFNIHLIISVGGVTGTPVDAKKISIVKLVISIKVSICFVIQICILILVFYIYNVLAIILSNLLQVTLEFKTKPLFIFVLFFSSTGSKHVIFLPLPDTGIELITSKEPDTF